MYLKVLYPIEQLRDYSSLFLRNEVLKWLNDDYSKLKLIISKYDQSIVNKDISYLRYLKYVYRVLKRDYPFEYIYKNEFLNQWVKKELGKGDSIVYNELRIGSATADIALFNGTSKVFEIKTSLDSDYRLSRQLNEYEKLFNEIYLIVPEQHLKKYLKCNDKIGIISYSTLHDNFVLQRKSVTQNHPDFSIAMNVLHTKEYRCIVSEYYGTLPEMNDFNQFEICEDLISKIPSADLNQLFIKTLKCRKINNLFFNKLNSEFNQICLSLNLNDINKHKLINKLNTKIEKHVLPLSKS